MISGLRAPMRGGSPALSQGGRHAWGPRGASVNVVAWSDTPGVAAGDMGEEDGGRAKPMHLPAFGKERARWKCLCPPAAR